MGNKKRQQTKPSADQHSGKQANSNTDDKKSKLSRLLNVNGAVTCAFIVLCYWLLVMKNGYMLRWYDEMSFFDSSQFFLYRSLHYPGGLLHYAGTWLTQLMYYPVLGSTVLIALWLALAWLTKKVFGMSGSYFPLCLVVPMCMLVSVVQLDEAWMSLNSAGYLYFNTLGYIFAVSSIFLYRLTAKRPAAAMIALMVTAVCYPLAGFFAILGASAGVILMVADSLRMKKYAGLAYVAVAIVFIIAVPNLYYSYFNGTSVDNDYLYLKGLPDLLMEDFDVYLWRPFIVASSWLFIMALLSRITIPDTNRILKYGSIAVVAVCAVWSINAEHKNQQLRATVLMLRHMENNDWNGMCGVMSRITESPNLTMLILNNVAVVNLGGRGGRFDGIQPVNKDSRHAEWFTMTGLINVPVNYYEGLFNESYRWAMEHSVQYGKRVFYLKYMVKDALLNGDIQLAKRYNDLLKSIMFHRKWAENMQRYIDNPALIESNPEFKSILELSRRHNKAN